MARIGFLACEGTLPGSDRRREDAWEHDLYVSAIQPSFEAGGHVFTVIDWEAPLSDFEGVDLLLLGTVWNYQDHEKRFLARLEALEAAGVTVCNSAEIVRWNIDKRYLKDMDARGTPTIPTLWVENATAAGIQSAHDTFLSEKIVAKRQVGAGAEGQFLFGPDTPVADDWHTQHPMMLQPFLASIQSEGEYSFIIIDGELSHVLNKSAAEGDYRIQSLYGGTESVVSPSDADQQAALTAYRCLPFADPLYARIDMVRGDDGDLLLMEAELIEPYLYPEQGPDLGARLARGIARRLEAAQSGTTLVP